VKLMYSRDIGALSLQKRSRKMREFASLGAARLPCLVSFHLRCVLVRLGNVLQAISIPFNILLLS
jgi:hypothetical protein